MNVILYCLLALSAALYGGNTSLQSLTLTVSPVTSLTLSGNPPTLSVQLDATGQASAQDSSTTYTALCNTSKKNSLKITGMLDSNLPSDTSLQVNLNSSLGKSRGTKTLSSTSQDLVTQISSSDTGTISYTFTVQNGWTIPAQTLVRIVTFTLTDS